MTLELRNYMKTVHPGMEISKPGCLKQRMKLNPLAFYEIYRHHNRNFYAEPGFSIFHGYLVLARLKSSDYKKEQFALSAPDTWVDINLDKSRTRHYKGTDIGRQMEELGGILLYGWLKQHCRGSVKRCLSKICQRKPLTASR